MIENPTIFLGIMKITPRKNEKNMFFATKHQNHDKTSKSRQKHQNRYKNIKIATKGLR